MSELLCPVRGCRLALGREAGRVFCERGHSFDVARSGYINLLQPQDRRSKLPGDSVAAVAARRRLHDRGVSGPLFAAVSELARPSTADFVLDAGCGDGFYLGSLASMSRCAGHGADISVPAVEAAARRYPGCEWIVANADRFIPYADNSFSLILSITARMNSAEFRRVLKRSGRLVVGVPSAADLAELRGPGRDRVERTVGAFSREFELLERRRVVASTELEAAAVDDLRVSIYRPSKTLTDQPMRVTLSLDLLLFGARE